MAHLKGEDLKDSWLSFTSSNNEPAFYAIYSHYFHYLNLIGNKRSFQEDKIKDSISDVFLYLWENRTNLQHINNHHNYIVTSFLRKLQQKKGMAIEEMAESETLSWFTSPSVEELYIQQYIDEAVSELLKEKVDQLADKQRHLIYQKFYLGLSYQEIAVGNDISINTVYNTIYKATSKLKSLISKEQETFLSLALGLTTIIILFFFQRQ